MVNQWFSIFQMVIYPLKMVIYPLKMAIYPLKGGDLFSNYIHLPS